MVLGGNSAAPGLTRRDFNPRLRPRPLLRRIPLLRILKARHGTATAQTTSGKNPSGRPCSTISAGSWFSGFYDHSKKQCRRYRPFQQDPARPLKRRHLKRNRLKQHRPCPHDPHLSNPHPYSIAGASRSGQNHPGSNIYLSFPKPISYASDMERMKRTMSGFQRTHHLANRSARMWTPGHWSSSGPVAFDNMPVNGSQCEAIHQLRIPHVRIAWPVSFSMLTNRLRMNRSRNPLLGRLPSVRILHCPVAPVTSMEGGELPDHPSQSWGENRFPRFRFRKIARCLNATALPRST